MEFQVLATDYDGTLACEGIVAPATIAAIERLRAAGRHALLVTGRELEDLAQIFPRANVFDAVVAENGGVLHFPRTGQLKLLHKAPPPELVSELRARKVSPLSVGHVLIATREPNEAVVLEVIKELGLEWKIIFNKGAVMLLPPGINKATGLAAALRIMGLSAAQCVAIGDAENDHTFLQACGCGVAVANALDSLKKRADYVTEHPDGQGVIESIELMSAGALPAKAASRQLAAT